MTTFSYKNYYGTIETDEKNLILHGKILFINDLVTYEADSMPQLKIEFETAVDDYLETCKEIGKQPDKAFSGSFNIRISPELHKKLSLYAVENKISLNESVTIAVNQLLSLKDKNISSEITDFLYEKISGFSFKEEIKTQPIKYVSDGNIITLTNDWD